MSGAITQCLLEWQARPRDADVASRLARQVYACLHDIARARLRRERDAIFTPTELVSETWLRIKPPGDSLAGRDQFYRLASTVMRHLLVDQARERLSTKQGGNMVRVTLSIADRQTTVDDEHLMDLDRALLRLADEHPRHADVVTLRCFGGMEMPEISRVLDTSLSTVKRDWRFACAWLADALGSGPTPTADYP